jgi:hypothetical protein
MEISLPFFLRQAGAGTLVAAALAAGVTVPAAGVTVPTACGARA